MAAPQKHKMADDGYFYKDDDVSVQNQDVRFSLLGGLGIAEIVLGVVMVIVGAIEAGLFSGTSEGECSSARLISCFGIWIGTWELIGGIFGTIVSKKPDERCLLKGCFGTNIAAFVFAASLLLAGFFFSTNLVFIGSCRESLNILFSCTIVLSFVSSICLIISIVNSSGLLGYCCCQKEKIAKD